jgi:hypothetical protein
MKQNLRIDTIAIHPKNREGKEFQGNVYETSEGKWSSFDDKGCNNQLVQMRGKWVTVETVVKGDYRNIIKFYSEAEMDPNEPVRELSNTPSYPVERSVTQDMGFSEYKYKVSVKQSAKGHLYLGDCTVRADELQPVLDEIQQMLQPLVAGFKEYNKTLGGESNGKENVQA